MSRPLTLEEREAVYFLRWKRRPSAMTVLPPVLPWEKPGYVKAEPRKPPPVKRDPVHKPTAKAVVVRKRITRSAEDTSPDHIRVLRAAYCAHFIKTGELNVDMLGDLKEYANAQSSAAANKADTTNWNEGLPGRTRRSEAHPAGAGPYVSELRAPDR